MSTDLGLKNKVVIVSGASRGLGFATALSFAKERASFITGTTLTVDSGETKIPL